MPRHQEKAGASRWFKLQIGAQKKPTLRSTRKSRSSCCQATVEGRGLLLPRPVASHTPPHSPRSTGVPVSTATSAQWSLHTSGMFAGKSLACMYDCWPWPSARGRRAQVMARLGARRASGVVGQRRTGVRREDEPVGQGQLDRVFSGRYDVFSPPAPAMPHRAALPIVATDTLN